MNRYVSFGFAFLFFAVVGFFGINNTIPSSSSNLIATSSTGGVMLSLETFYKDIFYRNNHNLYYLTDKDQPSLDFYNIPLANAQEQKEENDDINNNNEEENTDKYVILVFDRGYKTTFTKAKPILDKYIFVSLTVSAACSRVITA